MMRRRRHRHRKGRCKPTSPCKLGELNLGDRGRILNFFPEATDEINVDNPSFRIYHRLLQLGLLKGSEVEIKHEAPLGRDPIAVSVRGALIALRRNEANLIEVERLPNHA